MIDLNLYSNLKSTSINLYKIFIGVSDRISHIKTVIQEEREKQKKIKIKIMEKEKDGSKKRTNPTRRISLKAKTFEVKEEKQT